MFSHLTVLLFSVFLWLLESRVISFFIFLPRPSHFRTAQMHFLLFGCPYSWPTGSERDGNLQRQSAAGDELGSV